MAHTKAFTQVTQQAMNDSQQSLSLCHSKISLMRKAVPPNRWLWTLSLLCEETPVSLSKHKVVCSRLIRQLMHHLY